MRIEVKVAILRSRRPQYELAQTIGVSEYRLSKYVHGRATLRPEQERQLYQLLGVPVPGEEASATDAAH